MDVIIGWVIVMSFDLVFLYALVTAILDFDLEVSFCLFGFRFWSVWIGVFRYNGL